MVPQLSVIIPSHGTGPRIINNILSASILGRRDVEVIIRDNSEDPNKKSQLSNLSGENCSVIFSGDCSAEANVDYLLQAARGDFILFSCDDDFLSPYAIPDMLAEIDRIKDDQTIIGTTGDFIKEEQHHSTYVRFTGFDRLTAIDRFRGYFPENNHAIFQYSPIRREVVHKVWDTLSALPVRFSYHDILMNCLFLMNGRLTYQNRLFYIYSNKNWENEEVSTESDARYFEAAGLDGSAVCLTWLIAMFEGALLFTSKSPKIDVAPSERLQLAEHWVREWWPFFLFTSARRSPDGRFERKAVALAEKWKVRQNLDLAELLADLVAFFSLSSPEVAERYYAFWK